MHVKVLMTRKNQSFFSCQPSKIKKENKKDTKQYGRIVHIVEKAQ